MRTVDILLLAGTLVGTAATLIATIVKIRRRRAAKPMEPQA